MTLVKLDSGASIPTENIGFIESDGTAYFKHPIVTKHNDFQKCWKLSLFMTEDDRSRTADAMNGTDTNLRKKLGNLLDQLNARIKELEPRTRPEDISERLTLETIVQWMNEVLGE